MNHKVKEIYNIDKIIKIKLYDAIPSEWYHYKKRKTFLGFTLVKEGIYSSISFRLSDSYIGLEVPENHFLKGGVVYESPEVKMFFEGRYCLSKYFQTYYDAAEYFKNISMRINFVKNWNNG